MGSFSRDFSEMLIGSGVARRLPPNDCRTLEAELSSKLPWTGFHLSWGSLAGSTRFEWGQKSDAEAGSFLRGLALYRYPEVTILHSQTEGLRVTSFWLVGHLIEASCNAQQFFGIGGSATDPDWSTVTEFETGRVIWGLLPNPALNLTGLRSGG